MNIPTTLTRINDDILDCLLSHLNPIDYFSFVCSFSYIFKMFKSRRCPQYSVVGKPHTIDKTTQYITDRYIYNVLEYIAAEGKKEKQEEILLLFGALPKTNRVRIKNLSAENGMIRFYFMIYPLVIPIVHKGPDPNQIELSNRLIHEIVVRNYYKFITDEMVNNYPIVTRGDCFDGVGVYDKFCIESILNNKQKFWSLLGKKKCKYQLSFGYYARKQTDPFWSLQYPQDLDLVCCICKGELVEFGDEMILSIKTHYGYKSVYQISDQQDVYCPECDYRYMRCINPLCISINVKFDHIIPYEGCSNPSLITASEYDKLRFFYQYGGPSRLLESACGSNGGQALVWKCNDCHTEFVTSDK